MVRISQCLEKHEEILALLSRGYTRRQIADQLCLQKHAVQAYLQRRHIAGVPRELRRLKVDQTQLRALLAAGHTQRSIADRLGVSRSAIGRRSKGWGLDTSRTGPRAGSRHPEWDGGRMIDKYGYILIYVPLHPYARKVGRLGEHRLLVEVLRGQYLLPTDVVHHLDDTPYHNFPKNLEIYASNADHLKHELTARVKATPRSSIVGAYQSNQKFDHCPAPDETLAQCPEEIRQKLVYYIESFHPTIAQQGDPLRSILRSGAWRDPFQSAPMAQRTDSLPSII